MPGHNSTTGKKKKNPVEQKEHTVSHTKIHLLS